MTRQRFEEGPSFVYAPYVPQELLGAFQAYVDVENGHRMERVALTTWLPKIVRRAAVRAARRYLMRSGLSRPRCVAIKGVGFWMTTLDGPVRPGPGVVVNGQPELARLGKCLHKLGIFDGVLRERRGR